MPAAGVPARVAVPSPLSTKVTPVGSAPVSLSAGVGNPVVVTVNVPAVPDGERRAVGAGDRRRLVDGEREALGGVGEHAVGGGDRQRVGAAGARRGRAGERGRAVAVVHEGHARGQRPVSLSAGVGNPVVVTVNVPGVPVVNVVLSALVIAGAWSTVSVKLWVASGSTPLAAVIVSA